MLTEVNDDLFNTPHKYIAHGCNCMGVMGAGVALEIKRRWHRAFYEYNKMCTNFPGSKDGLLGRVQVVPVGNKTIINCFTQAGVGGPGRRVSYDAVADCFRAIVDMNIFSGDAVAIPRIGAGLGGGSWTVIEQIIRDEANGRLHVVVYNGPKK